MLKKKRVMKQYEVFPTAFKKLLQHVSVAGINFRTPRALKYMQARESLYTEIFFLLDSDLEIDSRVNDTRR